MDRFNPTNDLGTLYVDMSTSTQFIMHSCFDPGASKFFFFSWWVQI